MVIKKHLGEISTLCKTMATATRNDSDADVLTLEAPTAKPSAAECTSSPTSALLAASLCAYITRGTSQIP